MNEFSNSEHRWCVILAGGDGTRLRPLTRLVSADDRPKQFSPLLAGRTLLSATRQRAGNTFAADRTFYVVTRAHERYYAEALADVRPSRVLEQPVNKGTAPAILLSLLSLTQSDPNASVVFMPSDHYYGDETGFMERVNWAFEEAEHRSRSVILLGARPTNPEVEYGWIERGESLSSGCDGDLSPVRRFWEKPSPAVAQELFQGGALWNTFVMVGRVGAFLDMIRASAPGLYRAFAGYQPHPASNLAPLYDTLTPLDFSRAVLSLSEDNLLVLNAGAVGWSDLGEPQRVVELISQLNSDCGWIDSWRETGARACRRS